MDTLLSIFNLLANQLKAGDAIGFTFFTGYMSMFAASVFFFLERSQVDGKWKTSLLVSGLITMIAAVHYYYMRDYYLTISDLAASEGRALLPGEASPTQFRYIDWTLTVPLMCVEFYLLLRPYGAKVDLMWRLIAASVVMLVAGYIGEAFAAGAGNPGMHSIIWGTISTLGYVYIVYEAAAGPVKKLADASSNPEVAKAVRLLRNFVIVGWAIYPIGYMTMPGNLLAGTGLNLDLVYNIGDAINKIGFGLVVYQLAMKASKKDTAMA
ncbi:MAG: bacteriorhodopsin-like [Bacteroidia bacterium]|nr:bacteriorhodopsin-like [Bacteroidia bacterium]